MKSKFKIGDKVKIINYGHILWESKESYKKHFEAGRYKTERPKNLISEDEDFFFIDIRPDILGQKGVVDKVSEDQGKISYSISGIGAWYSEKQMEKI